MSTPLWMVKTFFSGIPTVSTIHACRSSDTVTKRSTRSASTRRIRFRRRSSPRGSACSRPCSPWMIAETPARRAPGMASIAGQLRECTMSGARRRSMAASRTQARGPRVAPGPSASTCTCSGRRVRSRPMVSVQMTVCLNPSCKALMRFTTPFSSPPTSSDRTVWATCSGRLAVALIGVLSSCSTRSGTRARGREAPRSAPTGRGPTGGRRGSAKRRGG